MKLSAFFSGIDTVWSSYSVPWLGMVTVTYIGIAYAANRFASTRESLPLLSWVYAFTLFFTMALMSAKSFDELLREPLTSVMIAAVVGAGTEVYQRAARPHWK